MLTWKCAQLFDHCAAQMDETHIIVAGGNEAVNQYSTAVSILAAENPIPAEAGSFDFASLKDEIEIGGKRSSPNRHNR